MLKKNQVLNDIKIIDYTYEGLGIAKYNNFAIFVKYAKINENYDIKIVKVEKNYCYAIIVSEYNLEYKCPIYKECGGCQVQHLTYEEQLDFKQNLISNLLNRNNIDTKVSNIISNDEMYGYRNKVQMPFALDADKKIYAGFYKKKSHDVVKVDYCYLQSKMTNELVEYICLLLNEVKETVYDNDKYKGNLRHLYIRESKINNEIMVVFVCNSNKINNQNEIVKKITSKFNNVKSIVINENNRRNSAVLGFKNYSIYNSNFITENLNQIKYKITPNVFFQVNTSQATKMYDLVYKYCNLTGKEHVLDAYCGTGSIGLYISKGAKKVTGVEIIKPSIDSAIINAKKNNITNCEFICADIKDVINKIKIDDLDVIIVDPPRSGLDANLINVINKTLPKTVVYVSCNPSTMVRDLKELTKNYDINEVTPVDMFSQTYHVECVVQITRK